MGLGGVGKRSDPLGFIFVTGRGEGGNVGRKNVGVSGGGKTMRVEGSRTEKKLGSR